MLTMMSVLRAPILGRLGRTLSAQSRPMLLRMWQMRLPSGRGMHHGCTCRHMRAHAVSPDSQHSFHASAFGKVVTPAPRFVPDKVHDSKHRGSQNLLIRHVLP